MKRNVGNRDRFARAALIGPAAIVGALVAGVGSALGIVLLVVAAIMLVTGATGFCPLYALLHVDTCPRRPAAGL